MRLSGEYCLEVLDLQAADAGLYTCEVRFFFCLFIQSIHCNQVDVFGHTFNVTHSLMVLGQMHEQ